MVLVYAIYILCNPVWSTKTVFIYTVCIFNYCFYSLFNTTLYNEETIFNVKQSVQVLLRYCNFQMYLKAVVSEFYNNI